MKKLTIALAGNPNCGKSTVFNALTGARQHVGNYPGVTVEKKEGTLKYKGYEINVVDLPGTYSLTAYSIDELVARDYVLDEKPDVIIDIVDASNLERNLYLTTQFIELGVPLVIALNMSDLAKKQGLKIDDKRLSELLGRYFIPTVANKKEGIDELLDTAVKVAEEKNTLRKTTISYGKEVNEELGKIEEIIKGDGDLPLKYSSRWLAVKLLEEDKEVIKDIMPSSSSSSILGQAEKSRHHLNKIFGDDAEAIIADRRYGFISGACSEAVKRTYEIRHTISDRIDQILINRILGLPIFLVLMYFVFKWTFVLSEPLMGYIEAVQGWLGGAAGGMLPGGSAIQGLVVDGIIGGVGSVLIFVPIIFLLFLAIAILEDSGYMARAAFIMDKIMHKIGLHGRSFIPMLIGFGCNVPAVMATRTIDDRKDRITTILVNPLMSCGARMPVYALLIGAFFPAAMAGRVLFSLYILGMVLAVIMAKIFRRFLLRGPASPFVMELPPYRIPTIRGVIIHMWQRGALYLEKAGTIIFAGCVLIWFLSSFPWEPQYSRDYDGMIAQVEQKLASMKDVELPEQGEEEEADYLAGLTPHQKIKMELQSGIENIENKMGMEKLEKSYAGRIGHAIAPVFAPCGFNDWRTSVGLIGGFIAKEIAIMQFIIIAAAVTGSVILLVRQFMKGYRGEGGCDSCSGNTQCSSNCRGKIR